MRREVCEGLRGDVVEIGFGIASILLPEVGLVRQDSVLDGLDDRELDLFLGALVLVLP